MLTLEPKPLGQLLIKSGQLQPAQLDLALQHQRRAKTQQLLGEILIEQKMCSAAQVTEALALAYGIPFARVTPKLADPKVIGILPREFLEQNGILPLFKVEETLTVAVPEPADVFLRDQIERLSGCRVQFVAATPQDIHATLQVYLPHDQAFVIDEILDDLDAQKFSHVRSAGAPDCTDAGANSPPVVNLVRYTLYNAIHEGATEIHFEPAEKDFRIRYSLDGRLAEKRRPPAALHAPVAYRLKWMAELNAAESRRPQDGTMRIVIDGRPVALSISTMPGRQGEVIVLRVLDSDRTPPHLEKLGFAYEPFKQWRKLLALPQGLVLVTGPSGSGKRTTLYASLRELNVTELNVCTAEAPVQATLPGINQLQIDDTRGLDFAAATSTILRQSPDVLMLS
ncbi:MAG TPA: ATPase, T2SS/T4P/T4SS family, partial [Tepidisphaeraceae bacterium]|nr:ATPase, T2SS/T4P/T4SS family [Tepidisphaeraceae bacterium]